MVASPAHMVARSWLTWLLINRARSFLILAQISISIEGFEEFDGGDLEVGRHIVISYQLPDEILKFQKLF